MNDLIFFSNNSYKIKEVKKILKYNNKLLTLKDLPKIIEPQENGDTFEKNAIIKSSFGFEKFGKPCFADDSGICVSALNNKPNVRSKRFQQESGGLNNALEIIINEVKKKKDFKAFFQTTIAITIEKNNTVCFEGIVNGKISSTPMGNKGFHYDPIFIPENSSKTYGQMSANEKNEISHRSIAIKKLKRFLENLVC